MRLTSKRALDFYLGRLLLTVLYVVVRMLGAVLRRDHSLAPVRSILIMKFQGLGSLVVCKPSLVELRRQYPQAKILFWGTPSTTVLAEQMPEFDEILVLNDRTFFTAVLSVFTAVRRLWRERIDWAFDLEAYSRLSSVLVTLSMGRNRAGFALEQLRIRRLVHTHLVYFNRYNYLGEAYARIIGLVLQKGSVVDANDYGSWRFDVDPLPTIPSPYLLFNIHAGDLPLERCWPRDSFRQLIDELLRRRLDVVAVSIGYGEVEVAYTAALAKGDRIINLSGKLNLTETIRAIANAELVVTNDSAPLHFALNAGVKVVGLFGPTRAETYLPPDRSNVAEAHMPLYCSPCIHHWEPSPCNGDNQCMKRLSVRQVLARCWELLGTSVQRQPVSVISEPKRGDSSSYYAGLVYKRPRRGRRRGGGPQQDLSKRGLSSTPET